jgi:hypothetical protein
MLKLFSQNMDISWTGPYPGYFPAFGKLYPHYYPHLTGDFYSKPHPSILLCLQDITKHEVFILFLQEVK